MKKVILAMVLLIGVASPGMSLSEVFIRATDVPDGVLSAPLPGGLGTVSGSPRALTQKISSLGDVGLGVAGGDVNGEIDGDEMMVFEFSQAVVIRDLVLGFLFPPNSGYGDGGPESAKVVATTEDGQVIVMYLTVEGCTTSVQCEPGPGAPNNCICPGEPTSFGPTNGSYPSCPPTGGPCFTVINCQAFWVGPDPQYNRIAASSSPALYPYSGSWNVNDPFGGLKIKTLQITANVGPYVSPGVGNSDVSFMAMVIEDDPAGPVGPVVSPFAGIVCGNPAQITIKKASLGAGCSSNLVGFPVLVEIADEARLKNKAYGGCVQQVDGYDILFKDVFQNRLAHEIEYYDGATGTLIAWVKVPTLSISADTTITMEYGDPGISGPTEDPAAVWDNRYKAVYHLNQLPQSEGKIYDSTGNALDLTPQGGNPDSNRVEAMVGYGLRFRGWDYLISSKALSLSNSGKFTFETWVKGDSYWGGRQAMVSVQDGNTHRSRTFVGYDYPMGMGIQYDYADSPPTYRVANKQPYSTWVHLVARYDGSKLEGFVNGVKTQFTYSPGWGSIAGPVTLGVWRGETGWLNWFLTEGFLDEVRISDDARDSCWIGTSYNNQGNPGSFYTIGWGGIVPR